jgi:hypothetical protein
MAMFVLDTFPNIHRLFQKEDLIFGHDIVHMDLQICQDSGLSGADIAFNRDDGGFSVKRRHDC